MRSRSSEASEKKDSRDLETFKEREKNKKVQESSNLFDVSIFNGIASTARQLINTPSVVAQVRIQISHSKLAFKSA